MASDTSHNNHENDHHSPEPQPQISKVVDSERSPQLDKVKARDRSGCTCASSRGKGEGSTEGGAGGNTSSTDYLILPPSSSMEADSTFDDTVSVRGDQGIEDDSIEVGSHGMIRFRDIYMAFARHSRCTCHPQGSRVVGSARHQGANASPTNSMLAEANSESDIRRSILSSYSSRSGMTCGTNTSALIAHVGGGILEGHSQLPLPALQHSLRDPVWQGQEVDHWSDMVAAGFQYPVELNLTEEPLATDFYEFDMW